MMAQKPVAELVEDRGGNPGVMALIGKIQLTWKKYLQASLVGQGITLKQYYTLLQLRANPFLYPTNIAEFLFCDRPTATVVIKNMERQGWVTRVRDPANRKMVRVTITEEGVDKLNQVRNLPELRRRFDANPLGCLNEHELEALTGMLDRVYQRVRGIANDEL
jgi:DNA-binding MarR family transcriptional regulator